MKFKKKLALVMAATATLTSIGITTAFANNCTDTDWTLKEGQGTKLTEERAKTDTTSGYCAVTSGGGSALGDMQLKNKDGGDLVGKYRVLPSVDFHGNVARYVPSNAFENGYTKVKMLIRLHNGRRYEDMHGKWSPDSV